MSRAHKASKGKERITVSLSQESAEFLRTMCAQVQSPSMSALFEKIVADLQGKIEMERLEQKIRAYYDALPQSSIQEDSAWGAVGEASLVPEEEDVKRSERALGEH